MPSSHNYTAVVPSPATEIDNALAPTGFVLIDAGTQEQVPRSDIPTLEGILRVVGLQLLQYNFRYFTMDSVATAPALEHLDQAGDPKSLSYFGEPVDNPYLVGGGFEIAPAAGDRGVLALQWAQNFVALSQRADYA